MVKIYQYIRGHRGRTWWVKTASVACCSCFTISSLFESRRMPAKPVPRQHGVNGVYLGGEWLDIEECAEKFNIKDGSHQDCLNRGQCKTCPRSRSKTVAAKGDGSYDVIIIGAGCIGASIARELSKSKLSVLVLESADDITQGATKVSQISHPDP